MTIGRRKNEENAPAEPQETVREAQTNQDHAAELNDAIAALRSRNEEMEKQMRMLREELENRISAMGSVKNHAPAKPTDPFLEGFGRLRR